LVHNSTYTIELSSTSVRWVVTFAATSYQRIGRSAKQPIYGEHPPDYVHQKLHSFALARVQCIPDADLLARRIMHNVDAFHTRGKWVFSFNKDTMLATTQIPAICFNLASDHFNVPAT